MLAFAWPPAQLTGSINKHLHDFSLPSKSKLHLALAHCIFKQAVGRTLVLNYTIEAFGLFTHGKGLSLTI